MNQEKRKRALALFEQPIDSENIAPYRNKYFHTTMAQDSLTNLDIDIDYENYDVITSGGDITIIDPDDPDDPIIINPTQLKASWVSYQQPSGVSATNVQIALDDLYNKIDIISSQVPYINGVPVTGSWSGHHYYLLNEIAIPDDEKPNDTNGGPITNIHSLLT